MYRKLIFKTIVICSFESNIRLQLHSKYGKHPCQFWYTNLLVNSILQLELSANIDYFDQAGEYIDQERAIDINGRTRKSLNQEQNLQFQLNEHSMYLLTLSKLISFSGINRTILYPARKYPPVSISPVINIIYVRAIATSNKRHEY